jgi:hypothetical protein
MPLFLAPLLASGLDLVANFALAKGKDALEKATGVKLPDDGKLSAEQITLLKKYQYENEEALANIRLEEDKLSIEAQRISAQDTDSARDREVKINESEHASWLSKNTGSLIALVFVGVYLYLNYGLLSAMFKPEDTVFTTIIGNMTNIVMLIVGFYYGSSKTMKDMAK